MEQDIMIMNNMFTTWGVTAARVEAPQEKPDAGNESLILVNEELINRSENAPLNSSASRHGKIAYSVSRNLLRLSTEVKDENLLCMEMLVNYMEHISTETIQVSTGGAEAVTFRDITLSRNMVVVLQSPFSLVS